MHLTRKVLVVPNRNLTSLSKFSLRDIITPDRKRRFVKEERHAILADNIITNVAAVHQNHDRVMYLDRNTMSFGWISCILPSVTSSFRLPNSQLELTEMDRKHFPSENDFVTLDSRYLYVLRQTKDKTKPGYKENGDVVTLLQLWAATNKKVVEADFFAFNEEAHATFLIHVYERTCSWC